jgi:beta-glucosidase
MTIISKGLHDHASLLFPHNFLWGASTSAHQVEGNNLHSDWWQWEQKALPQDMRSGIACDQYHRYESDFDLAKKLNHNAHRLSIEWARIEPKNGQFDEREIEHYRKVLKALKERGFVVMLTLWHFTLPQWLAEIGGWDNPKSVRYFLRFVKKVYPEIKDCVDLWVTLNEPNIYVGQAYINGGFPPNYKNKFLKAIRVYWHFASAHKKIYKYLHEQDKFIKVGIAHSDASFRTEQAHSVIEHIVVWFVDIWFNHLFYILTDLKTHDFLGVNYYFHARINANAGKHIPSLMNVSMMHRDVSDLGWEIYPEGIFDVLLDFSGYKKPIYITENGLASTNDDRRCRFLIAYLKEIFHAIAEGVEVKGYFHWSLIDNFEWEHGFAPRFGIVEIDREHDLTRIPRPSASIYAEIIKENGISHNMLRFLGHTVSAKEVLDMKPDLH